MSSNKEKINKKTDNKIEKNKVNSILIFIQAILAIILFISAIMSLFIPNMLKILEIIIVLFLVMGSINSYKINKNKVMSLLYFLASLMVILNSIVGLLIAK